MATTIHDVVNQTITAGSSYTYAYDVGAGQQTRSFFQVLISSLGAVDVRMSIQSPTNVGDRTAGLTAKGGGFGRRVELKTDAATPIQVPTGQSLIVKVTNLEPYTHEVNGWINGNYG